MRLVRQAWLWPLLLVACHDRTAPAAAASPAPPGPEAPPPARVVVTAQRTDLLFAWLDAAGRWHDATRLDDVPEAQRAQVLVRDLSQSPDALQADRYLYVADLRSPAPDGTFPCGAVSRRAFDKKGVPQLAAAAAEASDAAVVLYSASWCGVCQQAKAWLNARRVPFLERDVERDPGAADALARKARAAGFEPSGVPVIDVGGQLMMGFDSDALQRRLVDKGLLPKAL